MCRIPKVVIVAPSERHDELRKRLASISYDVAGTFATPSDIDLDADVAVVVNPSPGDLAALRERGVKIVAVAAADPGADLHLTPDELGTFSDRIWDLFRPA